MILSTISSLAELTKPRITLMILVSSAVGFWFGMFDRQISLTELARLGASLLGIGLMASGTAALNGWWERAADGHNRRTATRPIPSGRLRFGTVLLFGAGLASAGLADLVLAVNRLSGILCLATLLAYLLIYTPLKQRSVLCTAVGAIPGAMPPVIGFAASHGRITPARAGLRRDSVAVAVSAFVRNCMDVSRRLRARRNANAARSGPGRRVNRTAYGRGCGSPDTGQHSAGLDGNDKAVMIGDN